MTYTLKHDVEGGTLPFVICHLDNGQTIYAEAGAMSWMSPNIAYDTRTGGIGGAFGRILNNESFFRSYYTAQDGNGEIAIATKFPGEIISIELDGTRGYVVQKSSFLAATTDVKQEIFFQKRIGASLFGGEGFVMQRFSGRGTLLLEIDGSAWTRYLQPGEQIVVDTGCLALMDDTCSIDIQTVKGVKNMFFGGEGLFNTIITGPGNVTLQSHPLSTIAAYFGRFNRQE